MFNVLSLVYDLWNDRMGYKKYAPALLRSSVMFVALMNVAFDSEDPVYDHRRRHANLVIAQVKWIFLSNRLCRKFCPEMIRTLEFGSYVTILKNFDETFTFHIIFGLK